MGVRERKVENYLRDEVEKRGGLTRKIMKANLPGFPDQIVFLGGRVFLVEVKTIGGVVSPVQDREIARLEEVGADVSVVYGKTGVDEWLLEKEL